MKKWTNEELKTTEDDALVIQILRDRLDRISQHGPLGKRLISCIEKIESGAQLTQSEILEPETCILLALETVRESEGNRWIDYYFLPGYTLGCEKSFFRDAVTDFLYTEEGKAAINETCNDFNWGDVRMYIPDSFWLEHGIREAKLPCSDVIISNFAVLYADHDEVLIPDDLQRELSVG